MFKSVFEDEIRCRRLLEIVLGVAIAELRVVHTEHELHVHQGSRAGRVDVFARDTDGNEYDVEIQARHLGNEWLRVRHYQALMDAVRLRRGEPVNTLRLCVVIFVCDFDPLVGVPGVGPKECGYRRYDCRMVCEQTGCAVPDGRIAVLLNARGTRGEVSDELADFLRYVGGQQVDGSDFVDDIKRRIDELASDEAWMGEYMNFEDELRAERLYGERKGRADGLAKGREEGLKDGRKEGRAEGMALARALADAGRADELVAAMTDPATYERLLGEFGIGEGA